MTTNRWLIASLIVFAGVAGRTVLRTVSESRFPPEGYVALAGLGLVCLGAAATAVRVARGRPAGLVGAGGAAILLGVAALGAVLIEGVPGNLPPLFLFALVTLGLVGGVVLLVAGAVRLTGAGRTAPPAATSPASGARPSALAVWVVLPILIVAGAGLILASAVTEDGQVRLGGGEVLILVVTGGLYVNAVAQRLETPAGPRPERPPVRPAVAPAPAGDCPTCGRPIPAGSPQGLCPRCLLHGVMPPAGHPSPTLAFVEAFVAPPVEDVARLFPHLEVTELVGQGGMGAVYLARQPALDRPVALKLVRPREGDPTFAERFAREARALAKLSHPNVVTVHESGTAGGLPYLVMEYVDGLTLRDAMREQKLTAPAALAVVGQLCDALEYAHAQGVVHRDVKPENILVTRDGRVKIADFGLAKVADPAGVSLTGTHQAMGTPHYMAPEQWEKPAAVDHRADIYALGVVLYELLTGELPLGRFDPPSQKVRLDVRLDGVVLRALAKEPDRRYQHASQVRTDLDRIGSAPGGWERGRTFREYRSKQTLLGWPLVHVALGWDAETGQRKAARGWVAVGDGVAVGGVALAGGWAVGGLAAAGGGAVGLVTLAGGMALGGVALAGGWAVGALAAAAGGLAISGGLALAGGYALGQFAAGSSADGPYVFSAVRQSPDFVERLEEWVWWFADHLWPV